MSRSFRCTIASLFIACGCGFAAAGHAADLAECKQAKQRQLQLEQGGRQGASAAGTRGDRRRRAAELDEWLWKHCRAHSRALRELERERL